MMEMNSMKKSATLLWIFIAFKVHAQSKSESPFCFTICPEIVSVSSIRTNMEVFGTIGGKFKNGLIVGSGGGFLMSPDQPGGHVPFFLHSAFVPVRRRIRPYVAAKLGLDLYSHDYKGTNSPIAYARGGLFSNFATGLSVRLKKTRGVFIHASFVSFVTKQHFNYDGSHDKSVYTNIFFLGAGYKF
jgi:hypothetical protein